MTTAQNSRFIIPSSDWLFIVYMNGFLSWHSASAAAACARPGCRKPPAPPRRSGRIRPTHPCGRTGGRRRRRRQGTPGRWPRRRRAGVAGSSPLPPPVFGHLLHRLLFVLAVLDALEALAAGFRPLAEGGDLGLAFRNLPLQLGVGYAFHLFQPPVPIPGLRVPVPRLSILLHPGRIQVVPPEF